MFLPLVPEGNEPPPAWLAQCSSRQTDRAGAIEAGSSARRWDGMAVQAPPATIWTCRLICYLDGTTSPCSAVLARAGDANWFN